ncbi:hypothetical protein T07_3526 [Trichinella nelsoni]|uniref:Uncharacterized protein n=1 Tax=Trichinella nelsoni TaxID=6336 RepID=A0A0V0S3H6_9BILA|nr:hypothetical protein T07_3526 [Trichinella nelsoni]
MIAREIAASIGCWANGNMSKNMQPIRRTTGKIKLTTNGLRYVRCGMVRRSFNKAKVTVAMATQLANCT